MSLELILNHLEKTRSLQSSDDMQLTRFLGFALWYLLLLSCCLVPIMCAYRRNRRLSLVVRNAHLRRMAAMGAFQLSDNRTVNYVTSQAARVDKERKVQDAISKTTMTVSSNHLLKKQHDQNDSQEGVDEENNNLDSEFNALHLDGDHPNANRSVPIVCVICLCSYEVDDSVTFSSNENCRHAFHTECIKSWMDKKDTLLCPCCRQEFCSIEGDQPNAIDGV